MQKLSQYDDNTFLKPNEGASTSNNQNIIPKNVEKNPKTDFSQRLNDVLTGIKRTKDKNMYEIIKLNKMNEPPAKRKKIEGKESKTKQQILRTNRKSIIIESDSENDDQNEIITDENNVDHPDNSKNSSLLDSDSEDIFAEEKVVKNNQKPKKGSEKSKKKSDNSKNKNIENEVPASVNDGKKDELNRTVEVPKEKTDVQKESKKSPSVKKVTKKPITPVNQKSKNQNVTSENKSTIEPDRVKNMFAQFRFNNRENSIKKIPKTDSADVGKNKKVIKLNLEKSDLGETNLEKSDLDEINLQKSDLENLNLEEPHLNESSEGKSILDNSVLERSNPEKSSSDHFQNKKTLSKSTLDKLMKFKKVDKKTPEKKKENEVFDYSKLKKLASLSNKILSQGNKSSSQVLAEKDEEKSKDKSNSQTSQSIFTLEEQQWDDADLEL